MTPSVVRARFANSESVFKPDIFKGKVLFCTGGGSGICKEMTYAVVSSRFRSRLNPYLQRIGFGAEFALGPTDETWGERRHRWKKVRTPV